MNTARLKILKIVAVILIIAGAGFLVLRKRGSLPAPDSSVFKTRKQSGSAPAFDYTFVPASGSGAPSANPAPSPNNPAPSNPRPKLSKTYYNKELGIYFNYPEGFNVSGFAEGDAGYTILAQKPNAKESFQIFVSDFDEPGPITPERVKKDVPDMVIEDPKQVLIGMFSTSSNNNNFSSSGVEKLPSGKIPALIFFGKSESLGRTREVWFVHSGKLYQLTTYADLDSLIGPILETLRFQ